MKNIHDLRAEMISVFTDLKAEKIDTKLAHELSNAAGKILGTVGVQLKYSFLRNEVPDVAFLNTEEVTT